MRAQELRLIAWVRGLVESGAARSIREAARVSQPEVARTVRVDTSTISRWESGQRLPKGRAALRYAAVLQALLEK